MNKFLFLILCLFISGCATHNYAVKKGMSPEAVTALWGKPDKVKSSCNSCCWEKNQEAWHYFGTTWQFQEKNKSVVFEDNLVKYVFVGD
jgi:hypothetical protein